MEIMTAPKSNEKNQWSGNNFSAGPSKPKIKAGPENMDRPMVVHPAETPQNSPMSDRLKTY